MISDYVFVRNALSDLARAGFAVLKREADKKILAEALLREIRFNLAMVYEAENVSTPDKLGFDAGIFLRKMRTTAAEIVFSSGFPVSKLFKDKWTSPESSKRYSPYLAECKTEADLLEKALHRALVVKTMAQENILRDSVMLDYVIFLLRESEKVVKKYIRN